MTISELEHAMRYSTPMQYVDEGGGQKISGTVIALTKRRQRSGVMLWQVELSCTQGNSVLVVAPERLRPLFSPKTEDTSVMPLAVTTGGGEEAWQI